MGLKQEAVLARKDGIWETIGVTISRAPKTGHMAMTAYGVHIPAHKQTLVMATLAREQGNKL